jgi:hypothetical protein
MAARLRKMMKGIRARKCLIEEDIGGEDGKQMRVVGKQAREGPMCCEPVKRASDSLQTDSWRQPPTD